MSFQMAGGDKASMGKALLALVPEIRGDANIMLMGAAMGGAMGGFQQILGQAAGIPGLGQVIGKLQSKLGKANQVLSHASMAQGLFQQNPAQFLSGVSQMSPKLQKGLGALGMLNSGSAGGAGMALLGTIFKEFSQAKKAEGAIAKLFHAPWTQLGPGVFTELMSIKKKYPNDRLIDLKKKGYQPKYAPGFWGQVTSKGTVDLMKTVSQNEHWFWTKNWKDKGLSTPSHRTYAFAVWESVMKGTA